MPISNRSSKTNLISDETRKLLPALHDKLPEARTMSSCHNFRAPAPSPITTIPYSHHSPPKSILLNGKPPKPFTQQRLIKEH